MDLALYIYFNYLFIYLFIYLLICLLIYLTIFKNREHLIIFLTRETTLQHSNATDLTLAAVIGSKLEIAVIEVISGLTYKRGERVNFALY